MKLVTTTGRTINIDQVVFAQVHPFTMNVQIAGSSRLFNIGGDDYAPMLEALRQAGFAGNEILFNPEKIAYCVFEGARNARVYFDGTDRPILTTREVIDALSSNGNPAPVELAPEMPIGPAVVEPKTTKRKKAE